MPENTPPAPDPKPEAVPGEFDFAQPPPENPRVRRSLKTKSTTSLKRANVPTAARELAHEAPPIEPTPARAEAAPAPSTEEDEAAPAIEKPEAEPARQTPTYSSTTKASRPVTSLPTSNQPASPHGTRPATLYYSQRKDKEEPPTMKPTTGPASTTPSSATTSATSAPLRSSTAPASSMRPTTAVDYRANVERQSREQKSAGNLLAILVYSLIGMFVLGAALAGYGTYVVFEQLKAQSVTVSQLDAKYDGLTKTLADNLAKTQDNLAQANAVIAHQQELIAKEQESINKLVSSIQDTNAALRAERAARADETSTLRARVKDLETRMETARF